MVINTKSSGNDKVYENYKKALAKGKNVQFLIGDDGVAHYGTPSWLENNFGQSIISSNDYYDKITQATNAFNVANQDKVMSFNANEAQKNREWQAEMSNTAHQREVADLMKAGINPSLYLGAGASTPSGGIGSASNVSYDSTMNSAKMAQKLQERMIDKQNAAQQKLVDSQNANAKSIAELNAKVNREVLALDKDKLKEQIREFDNSQLLQYDAMANAKDIAGISAGAMNYSANMGYEGIKLSSETSEKNAKLSSQTTYDNSYISVGGSFMNSLFGVDTFSVSANVSIPAWVLSGGKQTIKDWFKDTFGYEPKKEPTPNKVLSGAKDVTVGSDGNPIRHHRTSKQSK